jgi:hypothetical protein
MDIFGALARVADVSRPGLRDRLPVAAIVLVTFFLISAGAPSRMYFGGATDQLAELSPTAGVTIVFAVVAATILLEPVLRFADNLLQGVVPGLVGRWMRARHRRKARYLTQRKQATLAELSYVA